jgi:hypothetical protein
MGGHVGGFGQRASGFCWGPCPFIWWCQEGPLSHSQNKLLICGVFSQGKVRLDFALLRERVLGTPLGSGH